MMNRHRPIGGGGVFKACDSRNRQIRGVFKNYMMNRNRPIGGVFKIYDEPHWSGVLKVYDSRNRQMRGVFKNI